MTEIDEIFSKLRVVTVKRNNAFVHVIKGEPEAKRELEDLLAEQVAAAREEELEWLLDLENAHISIRDRLAGLRRHSNE